MNQYTVVFTRTAERQIEHLSPRERAHIARRIDSLAEVPRPRGSKKLKGSESLYRIRWGDFRILYEVRNKILVVVVIRIEKRGEAYRKVKESGYAKE